MKTPFTPNSLAHTFEEADRAWSRELRARFGKYGGSVQRYTPEGKGEPGTPLRAAYEAREAARQAFTQAHGAPAVWKSIARSADADAAA